jgi:hypothetical protein
LTSNSADLHVVATYSMGPLEGSVVREERRAVHESGASAEDLDWRTRIRELPGTEVSR